LSVLTWSPGARGTDDEKPDVLRRQQRLVALDVHVDVRGAALRDLPDPIGARRVLGRRHHRRMPYFAHASTTSFESVATSRSPRSGLARRFVDVDDERLAGEVAKDLRGRRVD
jgi:hypothetical protein